MNPAFMMHYKCTYNIVLNTFITYLTNISKINFYTYSTDYTTIITILLYCLFFLLMSKWFNHDCHDFFENKQSFLFYFLS